MRKLFGSGLFLMPAFILTIGVCAFTFSFADDDDDDDRGSRKRSSRKAERDDTDSGSGGSGSKASSGSKSLKAVSNETYKKECGDCHFAYPPELLPSASWANIMKNLGDHFDEELEIAEADQKTISTYLAANGAEKSGARLSVKLMGSLRNPTPDRITEIPYISEQHHKISEKVLRRESIQSLSNCSACHRTAEEGLFDEDTVKIPRR